mmetsp:Transcript_5205/g.15918  ORF Transcript_5205/g.15918 Transcript_5205/m.15918 type:complete len:210 (+) Transcript_5205:750-1379(+)
MVNFCGPSRRLVPFSRHSSVHNGTCFLPDHPYPHFLIDTCFVLESLVGAPATRSPMHHSSLRHGGCPHTSSGQAVMTRAAASPCTLLPWLSAPRDRSLLDGRCVPPGGAAHLPMPVFPKLPQDPNLECRGLGPCSERQPLRRHRLQLPLQPQHLSPQKSQKVVSVARLVGRHHGQGRHHGRGSQIALPLVEHQFDGATAILQPRRGPLG